MKDSLSPSTSPAGVTENILLHEALEVLINELAILSEHRAEELPELKKKKVIVASLLRSMTSGSALPESDGFDLAALKALIRELEIRSRQEIKGHIDLIGCQLLALQEEHQYWRECLNVSFRKFCDPIP